ncbi:MAG: hypothetical protein ACTSUE_12190 [Promethearchaeota archaeon]
MMQYDPLTPEDVIQHIFTLISIPVLATILILIGRKWWITVDEDGKRNPLRFWIFFFVLVWFINLILIPVGELIAGHDIVHVYTQVDIYSISLSCVGIVGCGLAAYMYKKETLYYAALFFEIGGLIYYIGSWETSFSNSYLCPS